MRTIKPGEFDIVTMRWWVWNTSRGADQVGLGDLVPVLLDIEAQVDKINKELKARGFRQQLELWPHIRGDEGYYLPRPDLLEGTDEGEDE